MLCCGAGAVRAAWLSRICVMVTAQRWLCKSVVFVPRCLPRRPLIFFSTCSRVVRKSIARVLTVINQTQKENLRKFYKVSPNFLRGYFRYSQTH